MRHNIVTTLKKSIASRARETRQVSQRVVPRLHHLTRRDGIDKNSLIVQTMEDFSVKTAAGTRLKASLSEYLLKIKAGEEIIVTERRKPIAKLVPIVRSRRIPGRLREMEREGLVSVGKGKLPKDFWNLPRPRDPKGLVLKALLEERGGGRRCRNDKTPSRSGLKCREALSDRHHSPAAISARSAASGNSIGANIDAR